MEVIWRSDNHCIGKLFTGKDLAPVVKTVLCSNRVCLSSTLLAEIISIGNAHNLHRIRELQRILAICCTARASSYNNCRNGTLCSRLKWSHSKIKVGMSLTRRLATLCWRCRLSSSLASHRRNIYANKRCAHCKHTKSLEKLFSIHTESFRS